MASLDDTPVLEKGTSLRVGSWIFVADGSGGFESYSINQDPPEVLETAKRHEFDEFIDQLEEIGFSNFNNEARIQPEFDAIKAKTLSELEEDLENCWKIPSKKLPRTERPYFPIASASLNQVFRTKSQRLASRKLLAKRSSQKTLLQTSMILMKRSSTAS